MTVRAEESETTLTARVGNNADLLVDCVKMYANFGDVIVDVTYGKGVFWQKIDLSLYDFKGTDLEGGVDFKNLPYGDASVDLLVLDPPYMHGGATIKASINDCYRNQNTSHASVIRLYAGGILEAARVLKKKGRIFVKCQDEIESGKQRWSHLELMSILESFGFCALDLFVLQQKSVPAMRQKTQKTARKNHSFMIVAEFRG
jgi:hypothetical protein|tara:strand:- start:44 stop:649 length:606 start_codon:yes stop_codon:yes gene_type:complete